MERIRRIKGTDRGIRKVTTETKGTKPKSNIISQTITTNIRRTSPKTSSRATTITKITTNSTKAGTRPKPKGSTGITTITISIPIDSCHIRAKDRESKTGKRNNTMGDITS